MQFDLRVPLGALFSILGLVLMGEGAVHGAIVQGVNVNLVWGFVLAMFGAGALYFARRASR